MTQATVKHRCQLVSVEIEHISCRRQNECVSIECWRYETFTAQNMMHLHETIPDDVDVI